jgi:cytochrome c oxidase assembly protein subunit 15
MVTVSLVCVTIATAIAAWRRTPRRRDLTIFSLALVGGVFADAILGAFVVYTKLNPWLVCVHMLLSLGMVILGAVLYHRSKYLYGEGTRADVRAPRVQLVARVLWIPYVILLCAGTITTGSGPHAGSSAGQLRAKRLPFAFDYAVLVHAIVATVFLVLLLLVLRWVTSVGFSDRLTGGVKRLLTIAMLQMGIGVSQYFLHVPALLVELHVAGAVSLTIGMTQFHLRQAAREKDPVFLTSK